MSVKYMLTRNHVPHGIASDALLVIVIFVP